MLRLPPSLTAQTVIFLVAEPDVPVDTIFAISRPAGSNRMAPPTVSQLIASELVPALAVE